MGVLEILGLILGSGGISSLATWLFHIKAERRLKIAKAEHGEQIAQGMVTANDKDKCE